MSSRTIYVYDEDTGKIQYTVDDANDIQIEHFISKEIPIFVGSPKYKILGTYVKKDANTGAVIDISPVEHMDFISLNKDTLVANGTDEVIISGLKNLIHVNINEESSYIVTDVTGPTLEISANGFSYDPQHNKMIIKFRGYGYHDSKVQINLVEGD